MLESDQRPDAVDTAVDKWDSLKFQTEVAEAQAREACERVYGEKLRSGVNDYVPGTRAQMAGQGAVNALVVIGATLLIGIIVYAQIDSAAPNDHALNDTQQSVTDNVTASFDLGSILPIVVIAGAVLAYVSGFGRGGGGGGRR